MAPRLWLLTLATLAMSSPGAPLAHAQNDAAGLSVSFRTAARKVLPSVVTVRGLGGVPPVGGLPGFLPPGASFAGRDSSPDLGGSGVIVDAVKGLILTNDHVVPDAPRIFVVLPDGRERTVKSVRRDPRSDLALLTIDPSGLKLDQAEWGDSEALQLGDLVLAIGQPFGLAGTVTTGIVSAESRRFDAAGYDGLMQTSAAINPGSSGGPLIDLQGRIVGINVAIKSLGGGYEGVGFAVPSVFAKRVCADLMEHGRVRRAFLGVSTQPIEPGHGEKIGTMQAVRVASIVPESPAAKVGFERGDVIIKVGDKKIGSPGALRSAIEFAAIGEPISVSIVREGATHGVVGSARSFFPREWHRCCVETDRTKGIRLSPAGERILR